ncbi:MAG: VOC family protein [Pseudomonadota bacterium]
MQLGAFSLSLNVADLAASRKFYATLDFQEVAGDADQGWLILRNGDCTLGLFQGHIKKNLLTFNPGWVSEEETLADFDDIRAIQARMTQAGYTPQTPIDPATTGPASVTFTDPDGNLVFFDQHVPAPHTTAQTPPTETE